MTNTKNKKKKLRCRRWQWGMNHINTLKSMNCLSGIVEKNDVVISQLKLNYPDCKIYNELDDALKETLMDLLLLLLLLCILKMQKK